MTQQVVRLSPSSLCVADADVRLPPGGYFSTSESSCSCREASCGNGREQQRGGEGGREGEGKKQNKVIDSQQPQGVIGG